MNTTAVNSQDRTAIYYWKCDRSAAFHGTEESREYDYCIAEQLLPALERQFPGRDLSICPANGQGNHRTFKLKIDSQEAFVRTEDGPEADNYFDVETLVIAEMERRGIPVPRVLACDCERIETPFAWQVLEYIPYPDLNFHAKRGELNWSAVGRSIGGYIARWQGFKPNGFGPFSAFKAHRDKELQGLHANYRVYFMLNLDRHLKFLHERDFLSASLAADIRAAIKRNSGLLDLSEGCLVHKDMALWNILGAPDNVVAFIDWDDVICGDAMDDVALLGCFHKAKIIRHVLQGYAAVKPLPNNYRQRFWLHLLRNMIFKAVIRVGAGYFQRNDRFYLIDSGSNGMEFESFTRNRIEIALRGLNQGCDLSILS